MCLTFLLDFTSHFAESFMKEIGSQFGIVAGSRENSLYNALWVAQALLRKGYAVIYLVTLFKCHMSSITSRHCYWLYYFYLEELYHVLLINSIYFSTIDLQRQLTSACLFSQMRMILLVQLKEQLKQTWHGLHCSELR